MLKTTTSIINASQITGVLPVVNGGTGVTTSTGTGNTVLSASPTLSGDVNLSTGNLVIGTSGKGIDFSITSHPAGMTSELLADYEEGTWTPAQGSGLVVVGSFISAGTYTKVGRQVTVIFSVAGSTSIGINAGGIITNNLPFTSMAGIDSPGTVHRFGAAGSECIAAASATIVYNAAAVGVGGALQVSITYFV